MCMESTLYFRYRNYKKKITGTRSSLGTTASCYKVDVERVLWSFAISWSIHGWKRPFWTSILSEVRAIYYSSIQWTICALNWTWRSFPKDRVYIDVSFPCNSRSLHSWIPENTFKGGTLSRAASIRQPWIEMVLQYIFIVHWSSSRFDCGSMTSFAQEKNYHRSLIHRLFKVKREGSISKWKRDVLLRTWN